MDPATTVQFYLRSRVRMASGAFETAGAEAAALGRTVLVVTGRTAMRSAGLTDRLVRQIENAGARAVLFEEASPNPTTEEVDAGAALARREGVDVIVGLGGGSAMDVAKAISMVVAYRKTCYELCGVPLSEPGLPVVAVPTTSGTGAEVSGVAVVTEPSRRHKTSVRSPLVSPVVAVVDPQVTATMPPAVTASSGLDALAHAVESYLSINANPFSELFAERATSLALAHLRAACEDGADLAARTGMALASLAAGVTLSQAGVILGHGFGMVLGGLFGVDHGAAVGLLLPEVLEFHLPALEGRIAQLARRSAVAPPDPTAMGDAEAAALLVKSIRSLIEAVPLPPTLAAMGCDLAELPAIVSGVLVQAGTRNDPLPLAEAEIERFARRVIG